MTISKRDYDTLCKIARTLNDADEIDIDAYALWDALNQVIHNIKG